MILQINLKKKVVRIGFSFHSVTMSELTSESFDKDGNKMFPPFPPMFKEKHYLGTDNTSRDIVARLFYGFRIAINFHLYC